MNYFTDVANILRNNSNRILGKSLNAAIKGIQNLVNDLTITAGLPLAISERYKNFADDEGLLFTSDSYRDHFFHPFHTFLLGYTVLCKLKRRKLVSRLPFFFEKKFLQKWFLTALWHDITYVAEKGPECLEAFIKERLDVKIKADQDWGPIIWNGRTIGAMDTLCETFESRVIERQRTFRSWITKQLAERHDHGILSSLLLLREAQDWAIPNNLKNIDFIEECSLAIALHNYHQALSGDKKEDYIVRADSPAIKLGDLPIRDYPLAFLLAFCDTAQEWGRPSRRPASSDNLRYLGVEIALDGNDMPLICVKLENASSNYEAEEIRISKLRETWRDNEIAYYFVTPERKFY